VHGWVWKWGQQVGGDANWPCLGGSSGGDDHAKHGEIQEHNPLRQWTHQQATANSGKNFTCSFGRVYLERKFGHAPKSVADVFVYVWK